MAKRKGKKQSSTYIIFLAYFHRYGWIASMALTTYFTKRICVIGISCILFSIWNFLGYMLKWKHIYCSYQNAHHMPMTPDKIRWDTVKKADIYGVSAIFMILGIALLLV